MLFNDSQNLKDTLFILIEILCIIQDGFWFDPVKSKGKEPVKDKSTSSDEKTDVVIDLRCTKETADNN